MFDPNLSTHSSPFFPFDICTFFLCEVFYFCFVARSSRPFLFNSIYASIYTHLFFSFWTDFTPWQCHSFLIQPVLGRDLQYGAKIADNLSHSTGQHGLSLWITSSSICLHLNIRYFLQTVGAPPEN